MGFWIRLRHTDQLKTLVCLLKKQIKQFTCEEAAKNYNTKPNIKKYI